MSARGQVASESDGATDHYAEARAAGAALRDRLYVKLLCEKRTDLAARLSKCGQPVRLRCEGCQRIRSVFSRCDLKWCPSCQCALAARTADRYARIMAAIQWPLNVTFTAQNYDYDCADAVRQIRRAWGRLRRLRWFRARVVGGVVGFELTDRGKGYHAHCHAVIDCRWLAVDQCAPRIGASTDEWKRAGKIAAREVAEQWSLCCRRKASVHVRRLWTRDGDLRDALAECLKYSVKGSDLADEDGQPAGPLIDQLDRTRLVTSFGSCHGRPEFKRERKAPGLCECGCGRWLPEEVLLRRECRSLE